MDLIPLDAAAGSDPMVLTMTEAAVAMARVRTTEVGAAGQQWHAPGDPVHPGRLALDESSATVQSVNYPGRLERLLVMYAGEEARAGQQIGTIYSPELVVAQEELLEATKLTNLSPNRSPPPVTNCVTSKISDERIDEVARSGEVITNFPVYAERGGTVLEVRARGRLRHGRRNTLHPTYLSQLTPV